MKIYLALIVLLTIATGAFAQSPKTSPSAAQQFIVRKQQLVDDFELQMKELPYAAVRVYIRYKLAEWLWKKGKDDTGRAEGLAVKALEEVYTKREELAGSSRFQLTTDLFALLDTHAKETSVRLKAKHELDEDSDLFSGFGQLKNKDGDQAVAQKLINALAKPGNINNMVNPLLNSLRAIKSAQFPVVLGTFLDAVESGRATVNNGTLYSFLMHFNDPQTPPALKARYFALVVARARAATQTPDPIVYPLLASAITSFGEGSDLLPEAVALKTALAVAETAANRAQREAQERVDASADKLAAYIEEAEKSENPSLKSSLYRRAAGEAKRTGKFGVAIDVIGKVREIDKDEYIKDWADGELTSIVKLALEKNEVEAALAAADSIDDRIDRADGWKMAAEYFDAKKDTAAARDAIQKMLKIMSEPYTGEDGLRVHGLVRMLPTVQKIDKLDLPQAISMTARAINDYPTPGAEDRAGTSKYSNYVFNTMWLNMSLPRIMPLLLSTDRADAVDLAERINKREVRIVADLVLATEALDTAQREAEKKASEKQKTPATPRQ
jgi:hypothetical protein